MMFKKHGGPRIFVTVGSTKFTNLITSILSSFILDAVSQAVHQKGEQGEASIMIQFGATPIQDILLSDKLGLKDNDNGSGGSLPIKLLSGGFSKEALNFEQLAANLSPEAIKNDVVNGIVDTDENQIGLKHFSMEWEASHGKVHLEFIDYVSSIGPHLEVADVVISHAGELM
jgi:UDP-N-acetylglucosamine transferase subunit ALG13